MLVSTHSTAIAINNIFVWSGWTAFEAIGTMLAFLVGFAAIIQSKKQSIEQLEKEQEPFVIVEDPLVLETKIRGINKSTQSSVEQYQFKLKNVGRGVALRITGGVNKNRYNDAFFAGEFPHSYDLGPSESITTRVDKFRIDRMSKIKNAVLNEEYCTFYLFYSDQLKKKYTTCVVIKKRRRDIDKNIPKFYVVMENTRENRLWNLHKKTSINSGMKKEKSVN